VTNENGKGFIQFALSCSMIVGSTIFKHKNIHKVTLSTTVTAVYCYIPVVYLGTKVNSDGAVNKCYSGLIKHLMSKLLSHKVKCLIYKILIRPVLTDGSKTWSIGKQGQRLLRSLEKKVLWKIMGPILENGCWRRCKNCDCHEI